MAFEVDIFISYAHIDNLPLKEGDKGWVANFHGALEVRLAQLIGEKPRIWRDKKLQGNDFFGDEIVQQFPNTALMISILSPRYIKSEWCTKEVKEFCKAASAGIGTRIGNKSRIFKIIKTAVPFDAHPPEIADTLGYEFFISDADTGKIKELHDKCPADLEQMYWAKLDDIAHDIRDLLLQIKEPGAGGEAAAGQEQLSVYLAESTSDVAKQRDMIKRELIEYGYRILPDSQLPFVESQFIESVNSYLEQSVLSLHLVGSNWGIVPEGSQKSIVMLQNELAAQKSKSGGLARLIWLLAGEEIKNEQHSRFVDQLRSSPEAQHGADLFETSIEDFKHAIREKLDALKSRAAAAKGAFQNIATVYLAETNQELKEKRERIKEQLIERGCTVVPEEPLPLVYPDLKAKVVDLLSRCDVSIHLLGDHYGVVPEEADKSIPSIQLDLAGEKSEKGKLERLIWPSPIIEPDDRRQQSFIDTVKKTSGGKLRTHMVDAAEETIDAAIIETVEKIEESRRGPAPKEAPAADGGAAGEAAQGPRQIYLICDREDLENDDIAKVEDFLFDSGFEVILPVLEGKEEDVMNDHHENLRTCDAALIYYGAGSELWLRSISRDLTKIAGYGRTHPLLAKGVFLGPPTSRPKERFRSHDLLVIDGVAGFSASLMNPFTEKLK